MYIIIIIKNRINFWHNLKTNKYISKLPTESDSADSDSQKSLKKSVEKNCVYSTKTFQKLKLK